MRITQELFIIGNGIAAHYDYAPFGAVTRAISASTITDNTFTTDKALSSTLAEVPYKEAK